MHAHMETIVRNGKPDGRIGKEQIKDLRNAYRLWSSNGLRVRSKKWIPEKKVTLPLAIPVSGTADLLGYDRSTKTLICLDWKFGRRYIVKANDDDGHPNTQGLIYTSAAYCHFKDRYPIEAVEFHIVQPRKPGAMEETPEHWRMTINELREHVRPIAKTVRMIARDDPALEYAPSDDACRWCQVKDHCEAFATAKVDQRNAQSKEYSDALNAAHQAYNPIDEQKSSDPTIC